MCSGCRLDVQAHTWGKHGKSCTGPPPDIEKCGSTENATVLSPSINKHLRHLPAATSGVSQGRSLEFSDDDDDLATLQRRKTALEERIAKQKLQAEIAQLEKELQNCSVAALPTAPTSSSAHHQGLLSPEHQDSDISLAELRKMTNLRSQVDQELSPFINAIGANKEHEAENKGPAGEYNFRDNCAKFPAQHTGKKPVEFKSPEQFVPSYYSSHELKYDDLTLEQFLQGYTVLLQDPSMSKVEQRGRLRLLHDLFIKLPLYKWSVIRSYHAAVARLIELNRRTWDSDYSDVKEMFFDLSADKLSQSLRNAW